MKETHIEVRIIVNKVLMNVVRVFQYEWNNQVKLIHKIYNTKLVLLHVHAPHGLTYVISPNVARIPLLCASRDAIYINDKMQCPYNM